MVDEESAVSVVPHLKERIKSTPTTSVPPPFEHDLATVSHEINRSAAHYATRPYLSQLRAKCEKKYEKVDHHILKSLEVVAKVDDDKKAQSNKEDTGNTADDVESNDNHTVSLKKYPKK